MARICSDGGWRNGRWIPVVSIGRPEKTWTFVIPGGFHRVIMENCRGSMVTDASLYSALLHDEDGGIADRPDDMADVFTRFLVLLVLSLLGNLHSVENQVTPTDASTRSTRYRQMW
jgi:hypothetical protein